MPIRIKARAGESAEQLMRRFKKMCEKEGLTKDIKRNMYYEKPSEKKQRALRKSVKRTQQLEMIRMGIMPPRGPMRPGGRPGTGPKTGGGGGRGGPNRGAGGPPRTGGFGRPR